MKTVLASALLSLALLLGSCGGANAGESLLKIVTDKVAEVTTKFNDVKDVASAETAVKLAETALPAAKTAFDSLSGLASKAGAEGPIKDMLATATSKFGDLKGMLSGLAAKFAGNADLTKMLGDKIPALLKMLPGIGG